jgi:exopolyphosphatase / guanosine-5'-triphosphate,3'-diphosphate pyrophosphatase
VTEHLTAAVDLGSNSFHLLLARQRGEEWVPLERVKEKIQLGRGLAAGMLTEDALARGLACIERFAQRLAAVPRSRLRVVGTCALREARNSDVFLRAAEQTLGCPIRVLSGAEEAELIFLGVSHALTVDGRRRLVIDIGGGSTEFAVGRSFAPTRLTSLNLGCVTLAEVCFDGGRPLAAAYAEAREHAESLVAGLDQALEPGDWEEVIGTSGTVESIQSVLIANGWSRRHITREGLDRLQQALRDRHWTAQFGMPGLSPERIDIFPSGVAALAGIFSVLGIRTMTFCSATLLDGLLYDLSGRRSVENVQRRTVRSWRRRFGAAAAQVARVRQTALALWRDVRHAWQLDDDEAPELIAWAAELHEIGYGVSAHHPQRHGAYLIQNGDMPGLAPEQQRALALLVRCHQGGIPAFAFAAYDDVVALRLQRLAILLRVAVILQRSRRDEDRPEVAAVANGQSLRLTLHHSWLATHALSRAELETERARLNRLGVALEVREASAC